MNTTLHLKKHGNFGEFINQPKTNCTTKVYLKQKADFIIKIQNFLFGKNNKETCKITTKAKSINLFGLDFLQKQQEEDTKNQSNQQIFHGPDNQQNVVND
ncbi:hypothetical protein CVS40_7743 [Lucilia cuprina]|nr:hypothetical protein CVS40_7743 [Lucilia cuprina]